MPNLTNEEKIKYLQWVMRNNVPLSNDYNMEGFFKGLLSGDWAAANSVDPNDGQMHYTDKWKLPNHPTFSTSSAYYDPKTMPNTPSWEGGDLPNGGISWALRSPKGDVVSPDWPWWKKGLLGE